MNSIRERMRRITHELNGMREELTTLERSGVRELIEEMLTVEVTRDFKTSVDAVRHLLWVYIEAVAQPKSRRSRLRSPESEIAASHRNLAQPARGQCSCQCERPLVFCGPCECDG